MANKIMNMFQPIIELLQGISFPLAFIVIALGFLTMMIGQKRKGMETIKWAVVGYLLMQFLPSLMKILNQVAGAMIE